MRLSTLSAPVGALMRPTLHVEQFDSLQLASVRLRENGSTFLPVVDERRLVGVVTELSLGVAMAEMQEPTDSVTTALVEAPTIYPYETGAEALRRCTDSGLGALVVVDDNGHVMGLLSPSDLWPRKRARLRPAAVGGMATPFGVYLTTGGVSAGVHPLALVTTGMAMCAMLLIGLVSATLLSDQLARVGFGRQWVDGLSAGLTYFFFLLLMRVVPLSGTHGAEHQVVNAIERDEELEPDVVRRMPRVHPRCGTNIAAAVTIFLSLATWEWNRDLTTRLMVAALVTALTWRRFGSFLQFWITTKRPTDRQLANGIAAGNQLLDKYATSTVIHPSVIRRIWSSGMLHVVLGATLTSVLVGLIGKLFGYEVVSGLW